MSEIETPYRNNSSVNNSAPVHEDTGPPVLQLHIDDFEQVGPVRMRIVTVPPIGDPAQEVYFDWMRSSTMAIAIEPGKEPPFKVHAWRYPEEVARVVSKETRKPIDPADKRTWPEDLRLSGAVHKTYYDPMAGARRSMCRCQPPCPPSIDLPEGVIFDTKTPWLLRKDGPPVRLTDLQAVRDLEAARGSNPHRVKPRIINSPMEYESENPAPEPEPVVEMDPFGYDDEVVSTTAGPMPPANEEDLQIPDTTKEDRINFDKKTTEDAPPGES